MDLLEEILAAAPAHDDLELDENDLEWLQESQPANAFRDPCRLHLFCGDSIARDAPITVRKPDDILSLARGGQTWRLLLDTASEHVRSWTSTADRRQLEMGNAVIWLSGSDVYPRRQTTEPVTNLRQRCEALGYAVMGSVSAIHTVAREMLILGPLPRLMDLGRPWEQTPAYHLERQLRRLVDKSDDVTFLQLGRQLCTRKRSRHVVQDVDLFKEDGTHLSGKGYARLRFPIVSLFWWRAFILHVCVAVCVPLSYWSAAVTRANVRASLRRAVSPGRDSAR